MEWIATASFGLEGVVKRELQDLSLTAQAVNGGVRRKKPSVPTCGCAARTGCC